MNNSLSSSYEAFELTLTASCPKMRDFLTEMTINYLKSLDLKGLDIELAFYELSDKFKDNLALFWDDYQIVVRTSEISEEISVLLNSLLKSAIGEFSFREYRALSFLFLRRIYSSDLEGEDIDKLLLLQSFGAVSTKSYYAYKINTLQDWM